MLSYIYNSGKARDAYYQLVLYPVNACNNLYEMYYAVAMNRNWRIKDLRQTNSRPGERVLCATRCYRQINTVMQMANGRI